MSGAIMIYNGLGCSQNGPRILKDCLTKYADKYEAMFITPESIVEGGLQSDDIKLLVIGGGYDLGFIKALGDGGTDAISKFVQDGGSYLGICAGGYFGTSYCEFDRGGDMEVCGERRLKFYPGKCVGPVYPGFQYATEAGAHAAKIDVIDEKYPPTGRHIYCYINGGGYFTAKIDELQYGKRVRSYSNNHNKTAPTFHDDTNGNNSTINNINISDSLDKGDVISGLTSEESSRTVSTFIKGPCINKPAIVYCKVGKGNAVLSGVHFEYSLEDLIKLSNLDEDIIERVQRTDCERVELISYILGLLGVG